jgi:hypothetical protein
LVAQALLLGLEEGEEWEDTATNHLERLTGMVKEATRRDKSWPKSGRALGGALRRLAPNLKQAGVVVEFKEKRQPKTGARLISIRKGGEFCVTPVTLVTPVAEAVSEMGDANSPGVSQTSSPHSSIVTPNHVQGDEGDEGDDEIHTHSKNDDARLGRFDYAWEEEL